MPLLQLWLLGSWQAQLNGVPLAPLPTRHARALLARLALANHHPLSRLQLQHELFPAMPDERAVGSLRTALYYLRHAIGAALSSENDIALDPELEVSHDVGQFEAACASGYPGTVAKTLALYRGPFLDEPPDGWAKREAIRLHELYLALLRYAVTFAQAEGDRTLLLSAAGRWVAEQPWTEEAHLALISAWLAHDDPEAARAQIARARTLLQAEWSEPPSAEFEALSRVVGRAPVGMEDARRTTGARQPASSAAISPPSNVANFDRLPLFGRTRELHQLSEAWSLARQGPARALMIEGAAGTGKTRLIAELAAQVRLRGGSIVLWASADEHTRNSALGLARSLFAHLPDAAHEPLRAACAVLSAPEWAVLCRALPELPALLPERLPLDLLPLEGQAELARQRAALLALIGRLAARMPLMLVLENMHQADEQTQSWLEMLSQSSAQLLLLATQRPAAGSVPSAMPLMLLAPLADEVTRDLLRVALGGAIEAALLARLSERSGGNPLFAREILRTLHAQRALRWHVRSGWQLRQPHIHLPDPVTDLLTLRLAPLSPAARSLAELLAVVGRPAEEQLLQALWPEDNTRLDAQAELLEHWVLAEREDSLWFDHDWLGESLLQSLDAAARVPLHRRVAEALQQLPGSDPAERMRHHAGAGEWSAAFAEALEAGEAGYAGMHLPLVARAIETAERAADALAWTPRDPRRWPLLKLRERYHEKAGRTAESLKDLDVLEAVATEQHDTAWQMHALMRRGHWLRQTSQASQAAGVLRQAIALARAGGQAADGARAQHALALVLHDLGDADGALAALEEAIHQAKASGQDSLFFEIAPRYAHALMVDGRSAEADALLMSCVERPDAQRSPNVMANLAEMVGIVKMAARQYDSAFLWLREGLRHAHMSGAAFELVYAQYHLLKSLVAWGQVAEALPLAAEVILAAQTQRLSTAECLNRNELARIYFNTGDHPRALEQVQRSAQIIEPTRMAVYRSGTLMLLAQIALALGDVQAALAALQRAEPVAHKFMHIAAQVWLAANQREQARHAVETALNLSYRELSGEPYLESARWWILANVRAELAGPDAARETMERAYQHLTGDLSRMQSVPLRRSFVNATPAHRAIAAYPSQGPHRLVLLPAVAAPTGRALHPEEQVPVVWTLHAPQDAPLTTGPGRRARLQRLVGEALAQGAGATLDALAAALAVSTRTLMRDIEDLRAQGIDVQTRGPLLKSTRG